MLQLQTALSESLKGMLGSSDSLAKARERYKLEGLTGTYGTIPKPTGDYLTGDHQPQAAVIKLLAGRPYFKKGAEGAEMRDFDCITCHINPETDAKHPGITGYMYTSQACYDCHPTGTAGDFAFHDAM